MIRISTIVTSKGLSETIKKSALPYGYKHGTIFFTPKFSYATFIYAEFFYDKLPFREKHLFRLKPSHIFFTFSGSMSNTNY